MANYSFRCLDCGHEFSVSCAMDARAKEACPNCQSLNKEQLLVSISVNKGHKAAPMCPAGGCCPGCNQLH